MILCFIVSWIVFGNFYFRGGKIVYCKGSIYNLLFSRVVRVYLFIIMVIISLILYISIFV